MSDDLKHVVGCLTMIILLILLPFILLFSGWVLWVMWGWFLVPLLPPITWHAAVGISTVFMMIRCFSYTNRNDDKPSDIIKPVASLIIGLLLSLGIGFLMHSLGFGFHIPLEG